jgi:adenine phosphoribosyltransferase
MWNDSFWVNDKGWVSIRDYIEEVPDFPIKGISFKDISPLLADETMFQGVIDEMGDILVELPDYWIGIESRGFLFASALSYKFGGGVVMCRKAGKLPPPAARHEYKTEYSEDVLEMKIGTGSVVVVDDVLATGGTLQAVNDLCQTAGYTVIDNLVFIDLLYVQRTFNMVVDGAKEFDLEVKSLIQYE